MTSLPSNPISNNVDIQISIDRALQSNAQNFVHLKESNIKMKDLLEENFKEKAVYQKKMKDFLKIGQQIFILEKENEDKEKKIRSLELEVEHLKQSAESEKNSLTSLFQKENDNLRLIVETLNKKLDSVSFLDERNKALEKEVEQMRITVDKTVKQYDSMLKQIEMEYMMKYDQIKGALINNVEKYHKNVSKHNVDYIDATTKLTLLQNQQLIVDVNSYSLVINDLMTQKENLERKIKTLENDVQMHQCVEMSLSSKNRELKNKLGKLTADICTPVKLPDIKEKVTRSQAIRKQLIASKEGQSLMMPGISEHKIKDLELQLENKKKSINAIQKKLDEVHKTLIYYKTRHSWIFNLMDTAYKNLVNDSDFKSFLIVNNRDSESANSVDEMIEAGSFDTLSKKSKIDVLGLLMKFIFPLVADEIKFGNIIKRKELNNLGISLEVA